jgi:hypothetical protein
MKHFTASMWRWQHGKNRSRRVFLNVVFSVPNKLANDCDVVFNAALKEFAKHMRNPVLWLGKRFNFWSAQNDPSFPRGTGTFSYPDE